MKILALDTATEACSVALNCDGEIAGCLEMLPRQHSRRLLGMVDAMLRTHNVHMSELDALAFGCGPGSFTGLRVAAATVQGLAFALDKPVIPVSTLRALAQQGFLDCAERSVLAAIDARMDEVYWGVFRESCGLMHPVADEAVTSPDQVVLPETEAWFGIGSGWQLVNEMPEVERCDSGCYPRAEEIALLAADDFSRGLALGAEQVQPVYLRDRVALTKKERAEQKT